MRVNRKEGDEQGMSKLPQEKKKNNKGFSLVEMLIGVAILAVILIPIINNLAVSSRINVKARRIQEATVLGQNMLEGLKIESNFADVAKQLLYSRDSDFDLFTVADISGMTCQQVEETPTGFENVTEACVLPVKDDSGAIIDYSFQENAQRKYAFELKKIKYKNVNYCARVTYDASVYSNNEDATENINDKDMPIIHAVATDYNAVITQGYRDKWAESTLLDHYNKWFSKYTDPSLGVLNTQTNSTIEDNMRRTFTITMDYDTVSGKYMVKAELLYTLSETLISADPEYDVYREYSDTLYSGEFATLENVYLFYTPNLIQGSDTIKVINNLPGDKGNITFYLVEQSQTVKYGTYNEKMAGYRANFYLSEAEDPSLPAAPNKVFKTTIKHNLASSLPETIQEAVIDYKINPTDVINTQAFISVDEKKTRLYDITIDIYQMPPEGTDYFKQEQFVATFTTTKGEE